MKKLFAVCLAAVLAVLCVACGSGDTDTDTGNKATYTVGVCQIEAHPALDAATEGFRDALVEAFGDQVDIKVEIASGDVPTCGVICTGFVADGVDLILANATPSLQAAAAATDTIPILGTAVTEYGVALELNDFNGTVGGNISGTSDLAPLDQQANMVCELLPEAQTIGILYCSAEANSVYQAKVVQDALEAAGRNVIVYTFADSNDVTTVATTACGECDALYIPTDNKAATCAEAINNVAEPAGVPIIAGEENICKSCGVATLSIDYYELGRTTGEMAVRILKGEENVSDMAVEYFPNPVRKFNPTLAEAMHVDIPDGYEAIA